MSGHTIRAIKHPIAIGVIQTAITIDVVIGFIAKSIAIGIGLLQWIEWEGIVVVIYTITVDIGIGFIALTITVGIHKYRTWIIGIVVIGVLFGGPTITIHIRGIGF